MLMLLPGWPFHFFVPSQPMVGVGSGVRFEPTLRGKMCDVVHGDLEGLSKCIRGGVGVFLTKKYKFFAPLLATPPQPPHLASLFSPTTLQN